MSLKTIPPQNNFLYDEKWTADMDASFLRALNQEKRRGYWVPANVPLPSAVLTAIGIVNAEFKSSLSYIDARERLTILEARYKTFKEIVNRQESFWDRESNFVLLDDDLWKKIIRKNTLAKAYYHHGEPEFYQLASIFGSDDIKEENHQPVINISDDTFPHMPEPDCMVVEIDTEEVTSPILTSGGKVRRRLYEHDSQVLDCESQANSYGGRNYPPRNAFPPRPKESDNAGSSCASSSPFKWSTNPFK